MTKSKVWLCNAGIEFGDYMEALQTSTRGNIIVLKHDPSECKINNYNRAMMLAWQANMGIQYVLNAYACVMYVASYIMKTERSMGELLKSGLWVQSDELINQAAQKSR